MVLFHSKSVQATDDAGITVLKSVHPPPYTPGPYASAPAPIVHGVPSLSWICIQKLYHYPDQVDLTNLQIRLNYRSYLRFDSILIPDYPNIDPRLWATLVQVYDALPDKLESFPIPLDDVHLPLLQRIRSTPLFSLVTVLELPACPDLTDDTIVHLKFLHTLSAFDASATRITAYAIRSLAGTLQINGDAKPKDTRHRGPWMLRILRLRHCKAVTNDVFPHLLKFPLLSVIGASSLAST
ncbi:hypothetical protein BDQ12DRAFT_283456 [Crucibulum laeve]|uniref:Uncharacterized protein n=1 Tax=Crucibulum laeve TaxID=68775 RepID=A0A5C3MN46_9AGAR|nr:hypothetical protein BDQ12DRAFT_283456 [Crucibulum laeve]